MSTTRRLIFASLICCITILAQRSVDPRNSYHRVIGVLPLVVGSGPNDPMRPKYAPTTPPSGASSHGIIAFAFELSDDRKYAIAELVAADRAALAQVLADHSPGVLVFEKGVTARQQIETAIRQYRKDFSIDKFGVIVR